MRKTRTYFFVITLIAGCAGAAIIHVPGDVSSIQKGIIEASPGDTVVVAEGVYNEYIQLQGKDITVTGSNPDDWGVVSRTIIQPPTGFIGPVVQFAGTETSACVLAGLTIQKGQGSGIRGSNTHATLSRCWIRNNYGSNSGGITAVIGLIDRCRITGNSTSSSGAAGGLYACGDILNCLIAENYSGTVGGLSNCVGTISNCLIVNNRGMAAASGMAFCSGPILHSTIANNFSSGFAVPGVSFSSPSTISNCIIWGNQTVNAMGLAIIKDVSSPSDPTFSCFSNAPAENGNISVDPLLGPGFSLMAGSPCIDAGTNTPPIPLAPLDYRGANRMVDGDDAASVVTDMGAFEFDPLGISPVVNPEWIDIGAAEGMSSTPVKSFDLYNLDGYSGAFEFDTAGCAWLTVEPSGGNLSQTAQTISVRVDPTGLAEGAYTCNLGVVVDGTTRLVVPVVLHVGKVIRVPDNVTQIQGAIQWATDWDTIIVSPGTYRENLDFLGKKIYLRSVDPQDWDTVKSTIVDGRIARPCITMDKGEGPDSIVEGFTLQLGAGALVTTANFNGYAGGGILCLNSSPTIRRCQICWNGYRTLTPWSNNTGSYSADRGGGIALIGDCRARIEDCLVIQNAAQYRGGGLYAITSVGREHRARSSVDGCTQSGNIVPIVQPGTQSPSYGLDGSNTLLEVRNTIVAGERIQIANTDLIQHCLVSSYVYRYLDPKGVGTFEEIACKNGNLVGDPRFVKTYSSSNPTDYDFRLRADSPCINHGDPGFVEEGQKDLAGQRRVRDGRVDMGAFEFVPEIRVIHPMEGDIWAAGSRHDVVWTEYRGQPVVVNRGFEYSIIDFTTGATTTVKDETVPGWTIGPNSGVAYMPEKFDFMPAVGSQLTGFDRGSGVYQLLVDSFRPNCRYTLKLFVGNRKDSAAVTNWQVAMTAGDRGTVVTAVTHEDFGIPGLGKWITASLVVETGAEGEDANVGKQIGILLTGAPRVDFDEVSLEVADLAPTGTVDVELSTDNGENWQTLADDLPDTGSTPWTIASDAASDTCRVRAVSSRPDFVAVPSGLFAIRPYAAGEPVESRWPTEGHDMQRTGLTRENGPELGCVKWQHSLGSPMISGPVIGPDERIFVGSEDGTLAALDTAGQTIWTYELAAPLTGGITIGLDGTAYVGDQKGVLYAIDPAGQLRWKHQTRGMIVGAPAVTGDGWVIFGSVDGTIVALGADGSELWSFAVPGPGKVDGAVVASPTIGLDGNVYVGGMYNGKLYALDPADGHIVWTCDFEPGAANQHRSLANAPAVGPDGTIYATLLNDTRLYAVNPTDGSIVWTTNLAGSAGGDYSTDYPTRYKEVYPWATPAIGPDGTIYVAFDDPYVRAVNPDGTLRWARRLGMVGGFSVSVEANGKIYAAGDDRSLYVLDSEGTLLSRFDGSNWLSWPVIGADETLYVGDFAGTLWAIAPQPCDEKPERLARPADITLDGKIRLEDLAELAKVWKECTDTLRESPCLTAGSGWKRMTNSIYLSGDIDRDYYVRLSDLLAMAEKWLSD